MAKLTTKARKKIPTSKFAGPGRSYPIEDKNHARNAKARAAQFASPALRAKIDAKANTVLNAKKGASMVPGKKPIDQKTLGSMKQSLNFK